MAKVRLAFVMVSTFEFDSEEANGFPEWAFNSGAEMTAFLEDEINSEYGTRKGLSKMVNDWLGFIPPAVGDKDIYMRLQVAGSPNSYFFEGSLPNNGLHDPISEVLKNVLDRDAEH